MDARDVAWLAVLPCAAIVLAAIVLLGPPLGRVIAFGERADYWGTLLVNGAVRPEPTEHARYLLALSAPPLLAVVIGLSGRWTLRLDRRLLGVLVGVGELLVLMGGVACVIAQHYVHWGEPASEGQRAYFSWVAIGVAGVIALALAMAVCSERLRRRSGALLAETRWKRIAALSAAVLFTGVWLLTAVNSDSTIGGANPDVSSQLPWPLDESYAVLNGNAPLVGYQALYSQLWPYVAAGVMVVLGSTLTVYTVVMSVVTLSGLVAVFAVLRRVVRSSLGALVLYVPFLATGFFLVSGPLGNRYGPANLFSVFPERYAGAYLLAWLTARHLDDVRPRSAMALFFAGGLVVVSNVEFGVAALAGTLAALLATGHIPSRVEAARLLGKLAIGVAAAGGAISLLTLIVTGQLPHLGWLVSYVGIYSGGFAMSAMPTFGFHVAVYLTFVAALVVATVRALMRARDTLLTGMLAWSGIFGLGAAAYYVGESHPYQLVALFSAWALAIVLLVVAVARSASARGARLPRASELAVLFGFGLVLCSVAQTPTPWSQIQRLGVVGPPLLTRNALERFVDVGTAPGEPVLILTRLPNRIAYDTGVDNVSPYPALESMPTSGQLAEALDRLREAGGRKIFLMTPTLLPEAAALLTSAGFALARESGEFAEWRGRGGGAAR